MKKKKCFRMFGYVAKFLLAAVILITCCLGLKSANVFAEGGRDISNYINVENLTLFLADGTKVDVQAGASASSNLDDYSVDSASVDSGVLKLSMQLLSGDTLQSGDNFSVAIQTHSTGSAVDLSFPASTGNVDLRNGNTVIGQWRIESGNIIGEFNENAVGLSVTQPFELVFAKGSLRTWRIGYARIGQVTIGNKTFCFKIGAQGLHHLVDTKMQTGVATNNRINWAYIAGSSLTNSLMRSNGATGDAIDCIIEDSYEGATNITVGTMYALLPAPLNLQSGSDSSNLGYNFNVRPLFTEVTQQEGETYNAFKARVISTPLQYGVYKSSDGLFSAIFYFGRIGADGPSWSDLDANYMNLAIEKILDYGFYSEDQRSALIERMTASFGQNAVTRGKVPSYRVTVGATYPLALEERTFNSDAIFTYDGVRTPITGSGRLVGISSSIDVSSFSALLMQSDVDSGQVVAGGTYKLQLKGQDGEYTDYKASDGGESIRTVGDEGTILFSNLGVGTYRFAQVTSPEGYSKIQSKGYNEDDGIVYSEDFDIHANDQEGVIVLVQLKKGVDEEEEEDIEAPDTGAFSNTGEDFVKNALGIVLVGCGIIGGAILTHFAYRIIRRKMFD